MGSVSITVPRCARSCSIQELAACTFTLSTWRKSFMELWISWEFLPACWNKATRRTLPRWLPRALPGLRREIRSRVVLVKELLLRSKPTAQLSLRLAAKHTNLSREATRSSEMRYESLLSEWRRRRTGGGCSYCVENITVM